MKAWKRATRRLQCGSADGCHIEIGSVYLELQIGEMTRRLLRCEAHAGSAPKDIQEPNVPREARPPSTAKPLRWLATQAAQKVKRLTPRGDFDAKAAQAGRDA